MLHINGSHASLYSRNRTNLAWICLQWTPLNLWVMSSYWVASKHCVISDEIFWTDFLRLFFGALNCSKVLRAMNRGSSSSCWSLLISIWWSLFKLIRKRLNPAKRKSRTLWGGWRMRRLLVWPNCYSSFDKLDACHGWQEEIVASLGPRATRSTHFRIAASGIFLGGGSG